MLNSFYNNISLRKGLVTTLIITTLFMSGGFSFLLPKKAQAQWTDVGHIAFQAGKWVWEKVQWVWEKAKIAGQFVATNLTAVLMQEERAEHWADLAMQIVIETALRTLMAMITNDIIEWVQNGYKGKPAFMSSNFGDYLASAADAAGGDFITKFLGAGFLCEEIDDIFKYNEIPLLQEHTFDEKVKCTLSDIGANLSNFYDDFKQGGWKVWTEITTKPHYDFYGAVITAQSAKLEAEELAKQESERDAAMGGGYLSVKDCVWLDKNGQEVEKHENIRGFPSLPDACKPENLKAAGFTGPCTSKCTIKAPASTVANITNKSLTSGMDRINATLANLAAKGGSFFKPYIMAIGEVMVNKLITDGLASLKGEGPSSSNDKAPLPKGETLPDPSKIPSDTNKELIPVLTIKQNLDIANQVLQKLRSSQLKIIKLVDKLRTANHDQTNYTIDFMKSKNVNYTPNEYTPVEFFYLFDYFQPVFTSEIEWYELCVPNAHSGKWKGYFENRYKKEISYLSKDSVTSDSGLGGKRIEFELYDENLEEISDKTTETKDDNGNLIKTEHIAIEEQTNTYSFSVMNLIKEGIFTTKSVTTKTDTSELITKIIKDDWGMIIGQTTEWVDNSSTKTVVAEKDYSWFEWYINITNPNNDKNINLFYESNSQEAIDHIDDVFSGFIEQFQDLPGQTADQIDKTEESIDYLENTYIPAVDYYLETYENNLKAPESQIVLNAEKDMLDKKIIAIDKIKAIDPSFDSNNFEDLVENVIAFTEQKVEDDGELLSVIGDKDYPSGKDLYGLIEALDDIYDHLLTLYYMCRTGRYN
ncbi:hypothetical protein ACFLZ0_02340 [Patescibacteria group bacterium]